MKKRVALLIGWVGVIALLGYYVQQSLTISGDLRLFMPSPKTHTERLLLEEVGESPASRLLLVSLGGAAPEQLAETSQQLAAALREDAQFGLISNGAASIDAFPEKLLPYRYLLSSTLDRQQLDAESLRSELEQRLQDLSSPAGAVLEPLIPRDPTLEVLKLAEAWQPPKQPQRLYDVWFDSAGDAAILLVETKAAAFDPEGQENAGRALQKHFEEARADSQVRMTVSGPGAFSALVKKRTQAEATLIGTIDSIGLIALLFIAYRSLLTVVLGALPLASAGVAGLAAVSTMFGSVHGITLAFGFTLIGVAQDYPIHVFSHRHPGKTPLDTVRSVWPTLATGVVSTCIAYLAFLRSGVTGLAQLACFTITGLAVAGLTTRYLLPRVMPEKTRDPGQSVLLGRVWTSIASLPRPWWVGVALVVVCVGVLAVGRVPMWQNDLGQLTPIPQDLLATDMKLRQELGAADARRLLVVDGASSEEVLASLEALNARLDELVTRGDIASYDHAARYLPSIATQERRQRALPPPDALHSALAQATKGLPFKAGLFEPFVADVSQARSLPTLTPRSLAGTPLDLRVGGLLLHHGDRWTGLVTMGGVRNVQALEQLVAASVAATGVALRSAAVSGAAEHESAQAEAAESGTNRPAATSQQPLQQSPAATLTLLDLKQASEDLVARQRTHILWSLAIAAVLLAATIWVALRSPRRMARVIAPMALTTLIILAVLHGLGISLNLFHLIALVLAAGLGVDYALFFEAVDNDPAEQRRTLHAVLVCSLATLLVFAALALSTLPVLRAIGVTVTLGIVSNFVLALLLTRPSRNASSPPGANHARA
jgi:predicted exporter